MSSLFKGIAEHAGNLNPVFSPQQSTIGSLFLAQVLDVITGEQIQELLLSGEAAKNGRQASEYYKYTGAIRIKIQGYDRNRYEETTIRIAYPIDRGNYRLPIVGELVLIVMAYVMVNGVAAKNLFYTNIVGGMTQSTRHAIKPDAVTLGTNVSQPPWYEQGQGGAGLGSGFQAFSQALSQASGTEADKAADIAKRFEKKTQHDLDTITGTEFGVTTMREGDHLIEGRFGGVIRFTGTLTQKGAWPDTPYAKHLLKGSKDGDPMLIIKVPPVGSAADSDVPLVQASTAKTPAKKDDNINDDLSSLYINTTQNVPIEIQTSKNLFSWAYDIEVEPDTLFGKVDLTTTTIQATIADAYNPNDVVRISTNATIPTPPGVLPSGVGSSLAVSTGEVVTTGEYQAVLIAGLDGAGYKSLDQQVALLQSSFSGRIKGFRYQAPDSEILDFLKQTPKIHVFMFSAGCRKAEVVSKSPDVILDKIYIIEPYAVNGNDAVVKAVANGVPARHVFVGSSNATGKGVVPGAVSSNAPDHWSALAKGGQFIGT